MSVAIVVDSAAALPAELVEQLAIGIVPMNLVIDGRELRDTDITIEELLARLDSGGVSTSGPSPGEFASEIESALQRADEVLVLTISQQMSSTYASAEIAARLAEGTVRVLDTRTAAGGEALIVLAAARAAAGGASIDEVEAVVRDVANRVRLVAYVENLDHLARSGRVPNIARLAASTLHIDPLFEFRDGAAQALPPAIGHKSARGRIVQRCLSSRPSADAVLHVAALDALATDRARSLVDEVLAEVPNADWFIGSFGPVMLVHVGPGVSGLAWWWEDDAPIA